METAAAMMGSPQMWVTLGLLVVAMVLYVSEKLSVEVVSIGLLVAMMVIFDLMPVPGPGGRNLLSPEALLSGFGNPALITVMALLVVAEGLSRTGALDSLADGVGRLNMPPWGAVLASLAVVTVTSAFINDTPVVVMFLPVIQAVAMRAGLSPSRSMMPLSFAAILGGMTTLIGSSTNLLVSSALIGQGQAGLDFFQQTPMGVLLAAVGFVYVIVVMPRLLPKGPVSLGAHLGQGKQFVSQCTVPAGSPLHGATAAAGTFKALPDITIHLIVRGGRPVYPPYDDTTLEAGDVLVLAGTRKALADTAARFPGLLSMPENGEVDEEGDERPARPAPRDPSADEKVLVEAMIPPTSRFTGFSVEQLGLQRNYNLVVVGIERRARMLRAPSSEIRLQAGDVLLVLGRWSDIDELRTERDLVVVSGTAGPLRQVHHAKTAGLIFVAMLGLSAFGLIPIAVAALGAAVLLVALGALTPRQAIRAIDHKVVLLVGYALALGEAMEATGAAAFLAHLLLDQLGEVGPWIAVVAFFGLVAVVTNILSNNATAVLFTPIGIGMATQLGLDPHLLAITIILAANCSFATPIGYQTNLLVMGPGHYRFRDYAKAGLPLTLLLWAVFAVGAKVMWGL